MKGLKIGYQCKSEKVVRINGIDANMLSEDLNSLFGNVHDVPMFDALMLPKCDNIEHLKQVSVMVLIVRVLIAVNYFS